MINVLQLGLVSRFQLLYVEFPVLSWLSEHESITSGRRLGSVDFPISGTAVSMGFVRYTVRVVALDGHQRS